ncbi:PASTA domain-containing protein [Dactylosporangium salmoneum]|uniref:PASTA domain-containing protein n=1 Tax=Dactylosporangium salmoneum TaxID=53361 RepID=UPI0031CE45EF
MPVSGAPGGGRGTVYQTGAYPTVDPRTTPGPQAFQGQQAPQGFHGQQGPQEFQAPQGFQGAPGPAVRQGAPGPNRYVPPPPAPGYAAGAPVSPGPGSRVIPVYDEPPARPVRRERGNWLNALLVVVALVAVAGAGTTIYLVQKDDKPASTSHSPGPGAATSGDGEASAGTGGGPLGGDTTTTTEGTTDTTTHAPATTATRTETITMPDLSGLYIDYAKEKLRDAGFTGNIRTQNKTTNDPDDVNHVLAQDPKAQNKVAKNGTVTLTVGVAPKSPTASPPPSFAPTA